MINWPAPLTTGTKLWK